MTKIHSQQRERKGNVFRNGLLALIVVVSLLAGSFQAAAADAMYRVYVNGSLATSNAMIRDNTTLVPFKNVLAAMGYGVEYIAQSKTVRAKKSGTIISLTAGSKRAFLNGSPVLLTAAPMVYKGTTYVPLRFIADASKLPITVDNSIRVIQIGKTTANVVPSADPAKNNGSRFTFRNTTWGMSPAQVKKAETAEFDHSEQNGTILAYNGSLAGLDTTIAYFFTNNQLAEAYYFEEEHHFDPDEYISDYDSLKEILTEKYGAPQESNDEVWYDDLYMDEPRSKWGMAVATGGLVLSQTWVTKDTEISIMLHGGDYEVHLGISYKSLKYMGAIDQQRNNEDMSDV